MCEHLWDGLRTFAGRLNWTTSWATPPLYAYLDPVKMVRPTVVSALLLLGETVLILTYTLGRANLSISGGPSAIASPQRHRRQLWRDREL